jgi:osmotically inducible lipoprotein OsmB
MNASLIKSASAVLAAGVLLSGCENMSPETQGLLSGLASGAAAGGIASAAGASDSTATAIGLATGAAVGAIVYVIAKHEATERQRKIAEERARLAYAQMPPARKTRVRKTRYIAVPTVREKNSTGANSVMVYDTQTQQVVGNNVYDVKSTPKDGEVGKFDTYSAEYVGTGA